MRDVGIRHLFLDGCFHTVAVAHDPSAGWASDDCHFCWHFEKGSARTIAGRNFKFYVNLRSLQSTAVVAEDGTADAASGDEAETDGNTAANVAGNGATVRKPIMIDGESVPYASSYRYLGVDVNNKLDRKKMLEARYVRGRRILQEIAPVLGSVRIPIMLRRQVIVGLLIPAIAFAGELWGFDSTNKTAAMYQKLESLVDMACVMIMKGMRTFPKRNAVMGTSLKAMRDELRLPSIEAVMAGRAARAFVKYPFSKCLVRKMLSRTRSIETRSIWARKM